VSIGDAGLSARSAQVLYAYARAVDEGEVDGQLRLNHKRITVERVVAIPAGTQEYAGVPPVSAGTTTR
jgi:hypothetical protein